MLLDLLLEHLRGRPLSLGDALPLIIRWLSECDRGDSLDGDYNTMHVTGLALCAALDLHSVCTPTPEEPKDHRLRSRLFLVDIPISEFDVRMLQEFLCTLQTEFRSLYELNADGFTCCIDVSGMLMAVLRRLGHWVRHDFLPPPDDLSLHDLAHADATGWHALRPDVARHLLDAVHTLLCTHRMLILSTPLPPCELDFELHPVHREASMDTWWELATIADCPLGAITQYKHKFQYLFHSVSQVIYYHYPSYARRKQLPFEQLLSSEGGKDTPLHILPLLLQVAPDIPVLYEHTGAGFQGKLTKAKYAWCVLGHFVLLIQGNTHAFCALDPRTLLQHARRPCKAPSPNAMGVPHASSEDLSANAMD